MIKATVVCCCHYAVAVQDIFCQCDVIGICKSVPVSVAVAGNSIEFVVQDIGQCFCVQLWIGAGGNWCALWE